MLLQVHAAAVAHIRTTDPLLEGDLAEVGVGHVLKADLLTA